MSAEAGTSAEFRVQFVIWIIAFDVSKRAIELSWDAELIGGAENNIERFTESPAKRAAFISNFWLIRFGQAGETRMAFKRRIKPRRKETINSE